MTASLASTVEYNGAKGSAGWEGRCVRDADQFRGFVWNVVRERVSDAAAFEAALHGLATTGMATEFLGHLLNAVPDTEGWQVGEALAECVLQQDSEREVYWPWNTVRDRRTPRASLPGADLVGFWRIGESVRLLFGEVKTSSDAGTPPNVMYGGSGMTWQLEQSATRLDVQHTLLKWLSPRCHSDPYRDFFKKAVSRYLASEGRELVLVGVLIRDTEPSELDLKSRGEALSEKLGTPTRIELIAWYLPVPIADWPKLLQEEEMS